MLWDQEGRAASGANSGKWVEKIKLEPVNFLPKLFKFSWANLAHNPKKAQWDQFPSSGSPEAGLKSVLPIPVDN